MTVVCVRTAWDASSLPYVLLLERRKISPQHTLIRTLIVVGGQCRDKEHSTIIFEAPTENTPLLRLGWNKQDPRYMATILMDSSKVPPAP